MALVLLLSLNSQSSAVLRLDSSFLERMTSREGGKFYSFTHTLRGDERVSHNAPGVRANKSDCTVINASVGAAAAL